MRFSFSHPEYQIVGFWNAYRIVKYSFHLQRHCYFFVHVLEGELQWNGPSLAPPPRFKTRQKRAEGLKNKRNPGRWALSVAIQFHWCSVSGDKICEQLSTGPFGRVLVVRLSDSASRSFPRQTCKAFMDPMNQQLRGTYRKAQLANAMSS